MLYPGKQICVHLPPILIAIQLQRLRGFILAKVGIGAVGTRKTRGRRDGVQFEGFGAESQNGVDFVIGGTLPFVFAF